MPGLGDGNNRDIRPGVGKDGLSDSLDRRLDRKNSIGKICLPALRGGYDCRGDALLLN